MSQTAEASATPRAAAGQQIEVVYQRNEPLQRPMRVYLRVVAIDVPDGGSNVDLVGRHDA